MIRINLLAEKEDNTVLYTLQGIVYIVIMIGTLAGVTWWHAGIENEVGKLSEEKKYYTARKAELKDLEDKLNALEDKKALLKRKLMAIATLKAKRHGPVHILDDVNKALPANSWLKSVGELGSSITIEGVALDTQTVAEFMQNLEISPYIRNVDLDHTKMFEQKGSKLHEFVIRAQTVSLVDAVTADH